MRLEPVGAEGGRVLPRRDTDLAREGALQMRRTHSDCLRERIERWLLVHARVEIRASFRDRAIHCAVRGARIAALARAEARALRGVGIGEKFDVPAQRVARGAARLAVHARRAHGVHELPILRAIARDDGAPPCLIRARAHDATRMSSRVRERAGVAAPRGRYDDSGMRASVESWIISPNPKNCWKLMMSGRHFTGSMRSS